MSGKEAGGFNNTKKSELGDKSTEKGWKSELAKREQETWHNDVLGARVDVVPLPDYVTSDVQRNLRGLGFEEIIYMPSLDLKTVAYLRSVGVDRYLEELQQKYPKWKPLESLLDGERADHTVPRNLEKSYYWRHVEDGTIAFPVLPGQWMAVETVEKPSYDSSKYAKPPFAEKEIYTRTPFTGRLGFRDDRFNVSWSDVHKAIEREKNEILSDIRLPGQSVDLRLLEALEWNLLANRKGWGKTNTYEWTNTEYRESTDSFRVIVGGSVQGGAGCASSKRSAYSYDYVGFRAALVLGS